MLFFRARRIEIESNRSKVIRMKKYYVTTTENPKVLKFDVDTMYVYENGWKPSIYWRDKILVSDYVHFEEITEEKAYELIGRMVAKF